MFQGKRQRNLSIAVWLIYIFLLAWLILFKFATNIKDLDHFRNINFIPFGESVIVNGKIELREIIYNILAFVPLGVYISLFKPNWPFIQKAIPCLCLSLLFETLQYIFAIGASDITDTIGNTLGGILGIALYHLLNKLLKEKSVIIINTIGIIIECIAILLFILLSIANN